MEIYTDSEFILQFSKDLESSDLTPCSVNIQNPNNNTYKTIASTFLILFGKYFYLDNNSLYIKESGFKDFVELVSKYAYSTDKERVNIDLYSLIDKDYKVPTIDSRIDSSKKIGYQIEVYIAIIINLLDWNILQHCKPDKTEYEDAKKTGTILNNLAKNTDYITTDTFKHLLPATNEYNSNKINYSYIYSYIHENAGDDKITNDDSLIQAGGTIGTSKTQDEVENINQDDTSLKLTSETQDRDQHEDKDEDEDGGQYSEIKEQENIEDNETGGITFSGGKNTDTYKVSRLLTQKKKPRPPLKKSPKSRKR